MHDLSILESDSLGSVVQSPTTSASLSACNRFSTRIVLRRRTTGSGMARVSSPARPPLLSVRFALYDDSSVPPSIVDQSPPDVHTFIQVVPCLTYEYQRERGGNIPFTVIREVVENLIHADFQDAVISVLEHGNLVRVSDHGAGISDRQRALQPGYTTATARMRHWIRGVGSGLPTARASMERAGGRLEIEDNLRQGTVVTLRMCSPAPSASLREPAREEHTPGRAASETITPIEGRCLKLTDRQRRVLLYLAELESAGPSSVAEEVGLTLSTAHRELNRLENLKLVSALRSGKRRITEDGLEFVHVLFDPDLGHGVEHPPALPECDPVSPSGQRVLFRSP